MPVNVTIQIPNELAAALKSERVCSGVPTSEFIRRAVTALLAAKEDREYVHVVTGESFTADEIECKNEQARLESRI